MKTVEERLQELIQLGESQGYLYYDDINRLAPDSECSPDDLDEIALKLHEAGIAIIERPPAAGWQGARL